MEGNVTVSHFERLTTTESITFNNFIAKFNRNTNGFIAIKEGEEVSAINVDRILKLTPRDIHTL